MGQESYSVTLACSKEIRSQQLQTKSRQSRSCFLLRGWQVIFLFGEEEKRDYEGRLADVLKAPTFSCPFVCPDLGFSEIKCLIGWFHGGFTVVMGWFVKLVRLGVFLCHFSVWFFGSGKGARTSQAAWGQTLQILFRHWHRFCRVPRQKPIYHRKQPVCLW